MGKGGRPDADTLRGFRQQLKKARAAVQAQAEAYTEILETMESGSHLSKRASGRQHTVESEFVSNRTLMDWRS